MATYPEQLEVAKTYRVKEGGSYRGNCPFCGGKNTYGIDHFGGELRWGCFRASCDVSGINSDNPSTAGILTRLNGLEAPEKELPAIPSLLTPARNNPASMAFLEGSNARLAYDMGLVDVRYSPQEDRVMFPIGGREPVGYVGRARAGVKPKWRKYGDCSKLFTCGKGGTAVLVEDSLSAMAVGVLPEYTGAAILGTVLTQSHRVEFRQYDKVLVCLDPDANDKALGMVYRLSGTVPTSIRFLPNDLKYFKPDEIRNILEDDNY